MKNSESILIVDDKAANRQVLQDMMIALGYTPMLTENGFEALSQIHRQPPDLILLDILMPGMDGYEVLDRIKSDSSLLDIPVIMISAVEEMESVVRCIEQGAEDYLIKPFNPTLLKARIGSSLDKKRMRDQEKVYQKLIEEHNLQLEEKVRQKTKELSEAHDKLRILDKAKDDFLNLISHELRAPLTGIFVAAKLLFAENLDDEAREDLKQVFQNSSDRLLEILDEALLLTQIEVSDETFPIEPTAVQTILRSAVESASRFADSREVQLGQVPDCDELALGEKELLTKALAALLKTAVKFSNEGQLVTLSCSSTEDEIAIGIRATGQTIPEEAIPRFFEVFSIAEPITSGGDLGLSPAVAERILRLFDGTVTVENQEPPGISFMVRLKLAVVSSQDGFFRVFVH